MCEEQSIQPSIAHPSNQTAVHSSISQKSVFEPAMNIFIGISIVCQSSHPFIRNYHLFMKPAIHRDTTNITTHRSYMHPTSDPSIHPVTLADNGQRKFSNLRSKIPFSQSNLSHFYFNFQQFFFIAQEQIIRAIHSEISKFASKD